jgi:3',5'-cyclic AMP phosphodiesterase CpdA
MSSHVDDLSRRQALRCLAFGAAGTLFTLSGGVLMPRSVAEAADRPAEPGASAQPLFVQLSDTHIGFHKDANADVAGTLARALGMINALPSAPRLLLHTGDITHLSKPEEFELAASLLGTCRVKELHTVPGEHDVADADGSEYFRRFGRASDNRGYYAFDHGGVHFLALNNVMQAKDGGAGGLGEAQLAWALADLRRRSSSTPVVVFAHMPLWSVYAPWGWNTADAAPLLRALGRFGSVLVLNGHIHQVVQKVEGNVTYHTARSTAFPQPAPGAGAGPGPLKVPEAELARALGVTTVARGAHGAGLALADTSLAAG